MHTNVVKLHRGKKEMIVIKIRMIVTSGGDDGTVNREGPMGGFLGDDSVLFLDPVTIWVLI